MRTLALAVLLAAVAPAQDAILFRQVELWDGTGAAPRTTDVLVEQGRIVAIDARIDRPEGARVVEGAGLTLIPGLIAPEFTGGMEAGANEASSEVTPTFESASVVNPGARVFDRMLARGITAVLIPPGTGNVIGGFGCVVRPGLGHDRAFFARRRVALEIVLGRDPAAGNGRVSGPPGSFLVRRPGTRMGVGWLLRKSFADAVRFAETGDESGLEKEDAGPYAVEELQTLALASAGELPVRVTAFPAHDIETALRSARTFGFDERLVLVGCTEAYKMIDRLVEAGRPIVLDYRHDLATADYGEGGEVRLHTPRLLADAGLTFCLTTLYDLEDGPDLRMTAAFAHRHGLSAPRALRAITLDAAIVLGIDAETGSIEPGKRADLVLLDGPPLEPSSRILAVVAGGRPAIDLTEETKR